MTKKITTNRVTRQLLFLILCMVALFAGCKSAPVAEQKKSLPEVHPLALLDDESSIYIRVPVQHHIELTADILSAEVENLSADDAKTIAQQINLLFAGLGTVKDRSRIQLAANGSFPAIALQTVLTKKNGWNRQEYVAQSNEESLALDYPHTFYYFLREDTVFQIAFPSERIFCTGQQVFPLLEKYAVRPSYAETDITRWITKESDHILFYITKPGQYLRNLIGQPVSIGCKSIYGSLIYVPYKKVPETYSGNYSLSFTLQLTDARAMKAMLSLLRLAMGMMGGSVSQIDDMSIELSDIPITEKQIMDLFTRDPITGKHFVPIKE